MFEFKMTLFSKSESLLGIMFDQGQYNHQEKWIDFTRVRVGLFLFTLDFTWFTTASEI